MNLYMVMIFLDSQEHETSVFVDLEINFDILE